MAVLIGLYPCFRKPKRKREAGSAADAGPSESEQEGGPGGEGSPLGWGVGRSGGGALSGDVG